MSPTGTSMFYAGMSMATARAEIIATQQRGTKEIMTGATWHCTRSLNILDLTRLPPPPSVYNSYPRERDQLLFLKEFVKSITQPVTKASTDHTDYVPTQLLTEYFKNNYKTRESTPLDGIMYPSAQHQHGASIVIFATHDDINTPSTPEGQAAIPILTINAASIRRVRKARIRNAAVV